MLKKASGLQVIQLLSSEFEYDDDNQEQKRAPLDIGSHHFIVLNCPEDSVQLDDKIYKV